MTILDYYKNQQTKKIWYNKFFSSSNKQSGKTFSYINTNYRTLSSFFVQFSKFKDKLGKDRSDWDDKLPSGQETDKHRIANLIQAGFITEEDTRFIYTAKGIVLRDLINSTYHKQIKWLLLYLLMLDYTGNGRKCDIVLTTKELQCKLMRKGYSSEYIINEIEKILIIKDKTSLFCVDLFWLITFVNDEEFITRFTNSTEQEKRELKEYVITCTKNDDSLDLIAHKYVSSGVYSLLTFQDDVRVLYYTLLVLTIYKLPFEEFIDKIVNQFASKMDNSCSKIDIFTFINNHKSIFIKTKQEIIKIGGQLLCQY